MNSTMFNELKSFRDSLSNSFWLFSLGLEVRDPSRVRAAFDALLDHELSNLERRLVEKEDINSLSHMYLENRMTFPPKEEQEEEKEVSVHPPTLVIHPEPSVVVTKYEAPPTMGNEIKFLGKREEPVVLSGTDDEDEEVEAEEVEEEPEDAEEAEEEEDEGTEVVKVAKKKYHVGLVSRTVYEYIDEDSMGEALGTLTNGKIIAV